MATNKKHSVLAGVDYDPKGDMVLDPKKDGDVSVKYKGNEMGFDNYIDEMEEGKSITSKPFGLFGGFGPGTLKKPYKQNKK